MAGPGTGSTGPPSGYSFGQRLSSTGLGALALGPGEYDVGPATSGPRSPSFSFGSRLADRQAKSLDMVPGPGSYTSFVNRAYNPSFSMGTR